MNEIEVMKPLYPPEGSPVRGYGCCKCKVVTRTKRGIWAHLRLVHKIKKQAAFAFEQQSSSEKSATVGSTL